MGVVVVVMEVVAMVAALPTAAVTDAAVATP
jgi:hypothetical protein